MTHEDLREAVGRKCRVLFTAREFVYQKDPSSCDLTILGVTEEDEPKYLIDGFVSSKRTHDSKGAKLLYGKANGSNECLFILPKDIILEDDDYEDTGNLFNNRDL